MKNTQQDQEAIIRALRLEPHVEGGYYRRTFESEHLADNAQRCTMTSIYYLLTADSPIGHWHQNRSDILHYYHLGSPLHYYMIHPDGTLETAIVGPDLAAGQQLQLIVRGGTWKASHLPRGDYGLVSEAVSPGFEYKDMILGHREALLEQFPQHAELVQTYTRQLDSP